MKSGVSAFMSRIVCVIIRGASPETSSKRLSGEPLLVFELLKSFCLTASLRTNNRLYP